MFLSEQPSPYCIDAVRERENKGHEKCRGVDMNTGIGSSKKSIMLNHE
jgi:hypothetical protein